MEVARPGWFDRFRESTLMLSRWLERIGLVALASMILASVIDVVGSKLFHWSLPGSTELVGVIQVVMVAGGLAISKAAGNQIFIDLVMGVVPKRVKAGLEVFSALLGLALFVIIGWQIYLYGVSLFQSGTKTLLLGLPLYPFTFWIAVCCIPIGLVIFIELVNSIGKMLK